MKVGRFFEGFIFGGLLGAAAALLFAPSSGEALCSKVKDEMGRVRTEVERAAEDRRAELEQRIAELRSPKPSNPKAG